MRYSPIIEDRYDEESYRSNLTKVSKWKKGCRLPNENPDKWDSVHESFGKVTLRVKINN